MAIARKATNTGEDVGKRKFVVYGWRCSDAASVVLSVEVPQKAKHRTTVVSTPENFPN